MDVYEYVAKLPNDALAAIERICSDFREFHITNIAEAEESDLDWQAYGLRGYYEFWEISQQIQKALGMIGPVPLPSRIDPDEILTYFNELQYQVSTAVVQSAISLKYGTAENMLRFSKERSTKIQEMTNGLRDLVIAADYLDDKHRRRMLNRLEKFQGELHKAVSDLDVWLAGIVDVAEVAEQIGQKAKPIVDRMKEIVGLVKEALPKRIEAEKEPKRIEDKRETDDAAGADD